MNKENPNSIKAIYLTINYNDKLLSTATGFFVKKEEVVYLITAWHVVSGRHFETKECLDEKTCAIPNNITIKYKGLNNTWGKYGINLYDENDNKRWMEHKEFGSDVDVVAIPLPEITNKIGNHLLFDIDCNYELYVTEQAFILGYPYGLSIGKKINPHAIWSSGTIASDPCLEYEIGGKKKPMFLIDSRTREGQSGAPVIYYNEEGKDYHYKEKGIAIWGEPIMRPIGIYSGRTSKDSDLGFVWKWSILNDIIN